MTQMLRNTDLHGFLKISDNPRLEISVIRVPIQIKNNPNFNQNADDTDATQHRFTRIS